VQSQESASLTRAEVRADLVRAGQAGLLNQPDSVYPLPIPQQTSQMAATPDATQAVGGTMPMSSQSGSNSKYVPSLDSVYRGN
jgi:hypothetical protein